MGICNSQEDVADQSSVLPSKESFNANESPTVHESQQNARVVIMVNRYQKSMMMRRSLNTYLQEDQKSEAQANRRSINIIFADNSLIEQLVYQKQKITIQKVGGKPTLSHINKHAFNVGYLQMLVEVKWARLLNLRINNNQIGSLGCKYLSKAQMPYLQQLGLIQNNICDQGLIHLSKMPLKKLKSLYLQNNKICKGLHILIRIPMPKISYINLSSNYLSSFELQIFLLGGNNKLRFVDLTWNKIENLKEKHRNGYLFSKKYQFLDDYSRLLNIGILEC